MVFITAGVAIYGLIQLKYAKKGDGAGASYDCGSLPAIEGLDLTRAILDDASTSALSSPSCCSRQAVPESVYKLMQQLEEKERAIGARDDGGRTRVVLFRKLGRNNGSSPRADSMSTIGWPSAESTRADCLSQTQIGGRKKEMLFGKLFSKNGKPPRAESFKMGWTSVESTREGGLSEPPIGAVVTDEIAWVPDSKGSDWWNATFREFKQRSIRHATHNYAAKIGVGGFSSVYHGMLPTGMQVAVKVSTERPNSNSKPGDHFNRWLSELKLTKLCEHRHVLKVLGYSYQKKKGPGMSLANPLRRKSLKMPNPRADLLEEPASPFKGMQVLEFMENGDLSAVLESPHFSMDWNARLDVLVGAATGLAYIHSQGVVHRDIKPANIFLDHDFCPKIGDFGISKAICQVPDSPTTSSTASGIFSAEEESSSSDLDSPNRPAAASYDITSARGTIGYLDPDYLSTGVLTFKSDVFSFGVTILNVVSGKKAFELAELEDETRARTLVVEGRVAEIIDTRLRTTCSQLVSQATDLTRMSFLCMQRSPAARPTMEQVLSLLHSVRNTETSSSELLDSLWEEYSRSKHDFMKDINSILDQRLQPFDTAQSSSQMG